ncbi:MAG: UTP--glucose-1-phosphate uridylyltransferase GalU [Chloroflexi bacterium]|nr:UTP--glucose-1-phosphate uridylyltransferase GalU [Chloroflexota bacterium]
MKVRKAVVLAAGWGTRFLPVTKAVPKELLPVVDKPVVHYVMEEIVAAGITIIILVTAQGKHAVENYFDRAAELERVLAERNQTDLLRLAQSPTGLAQISYVRQREQLGIGHAVLTAEPFVGEEPFALVFPDDIIVGGQGPAIGELVSVYEQQGGSVVAVERVPSDQIRRYGIVDVAPLGERVYRARNLVEKPEPEEAPSDLGIVGRYVLTPSIFDAIRATPKGKGGEIQITDALQRLAHREGVYACEFTGERYDTGTPLGLLKASIALGLQRPDLGKDLREYLKGLEL